MKRKTFRSTFHADTGLLALRIWESELAEEDKVREIPPSEPSTPLFVLGTEDGFDPTSFVLFASHDEKEDRLTGRITGIEVQDFYQSYPVLREALAKKIRRAIPRKSGSPDFEIDYDNVNLGELDQDLVHSKDTIKFLVDLPKLLDAIHVTISRMVGASEGGHGHDGLSAKRRGIMHEARKVSAPLMVEEEAEEHLLVVA